MSETTEATSSLATRLSPRCRWSANPHLATRVTSSPASTSATFTAVANPRSQTSTTTARDRPHDDGAAIPRRDGREPRRREEGHDDEQGCCCGHGFGPTAQDAREAATHVLFAHRRHQLVLAEVDVLWFFAVGPARLVALALGLAGWDVHRSDFSRPRRPRVTGRARGYNMGSDGFEKCSSERWGREKHFYVGRRGDTGAHSIPTRLGLQKPSRPHPSDRL